MGTARSRVGLHRFKLASRSRFSARHRACEARLRPLVGPCFLGDETTLGLAEALIHDLPPGTPVTGALELAAPDTGAIAATQLPLTAVVRPSEMHRGQPLLDWLAHQKLPADPRSGIIWVSGEVSSVLRVRDALRERGIEKPQVCLKAYWSVRGNAHRKQVERRDLAS